MAAAAAGAEEKTDPQLQSVRSPSWSCTRNIREDQRNIMGWPAGR